ncbi:one cut domain family member 2 isoform X1 [Festucalex cinctus]
MELTMDNLHGISSHSQAGNLMSSRPSPGSPISSSSRNLQAQPRSAMVSGMTSILDGAAGGDYRAEASALPGHLHPSIGMSCGGESGMSLSNTYTTLAPLQQHLPPISAVSDKFHHPHHQRLSSANVSGSFTLMRDDHHHHQHRGGGLAPMHAGNLYNHYPKEMSGMGHGGSLSPLPALHNPQQSYGPGAHLPAEAKMLPSPVTGFEPHASMQEHLARSLGGHSMIANLNGMHHHHHHHHHHPHGHLHSQPGAGPVMLHGDRDRHGGGQGVAGSGIQAEEINTKEVAQRITAELKRYSIPQAIFAQRILSRSQGTLSDLLRNPKPWSKLKSGRETFRRMWKWLQEPEFQRMSALRLAVVRPGRERARLAAHKARSHPSVHGSTSSSTHVSARRKTEDESATRCQRSSDLCSPTCSVVPW